VKKEKREKTWRKTQIEASVGVANYGKKKGKK